MDQGQQPEKHLHPSQRSPASPLTRRSFLRDASATLGTLTLASASATASPAPQPSSFLDLLRPPDSITAYSSFQKTIPVEPTLLHRTGSRWTGGQILVETEPGPHFLDLTLTSPSAPIAILHLRWSLPVAPHLLALGDAWERSYGELGWRNLIPERVLPWYFATWDGSACHGYGVKTDARALCFWQIDPEGVSLWLNTCNGGNGVQLGQRRLKLASITTRRGTPGEDAVSAVTGLCRTLCARPSRTLSPIYGANDWNYSYGRSTSESILRDTDFIVEVSPSSGIRPFSVIDGGWTNRTAAWPDMASLAAGIRQRTARPGIWIRPLEAPPETPQELLLPGERFGPIQSRNRHELAFDPTIPDAQQKIRDKFRELTAWGYELIKHDFSTYDLLGQWGFEMGPQPTLPGWSLHDPTRTNAEVLTDLYALIREAAGDGIVIDGCNTIGHLGQGLFDLQRTGDDTSGHQWERTRRMGVNTLAFRLPQQGTFFTIDPDLVGITDAIPWEFNRQWLDVLARSGAATMISPGPPSRGPEQRAAIRAAFALAAAGGDAARPGDWFDGSTPSRWYSASSKSKELLYKWDGPSGASPFLAP